MRHKARKVPYGETADKGSVFKKHPPLQRDSNITKDSDAYRLCSYERQERTMSISLQKKLDTAQFLQRVELENQERLLRLTSISDPKKACCLTWSIGDYQDVEIEDNSVIYLDPPYLSGDKMTNEYVNGGDNFDHERFYDWCLKQTQPLYISSYEMPEKDFKVVAEFARIDTMSATNNGKLVSEKLFMPRTQETKGNIQLSLF